MGQTHTTRLGIARENQRAGHSAFFDANHEPVVYANEPYAAEIPGCWDGTSPNGDDADATINTISHEQNEAITDPAGDAWLAAGGSEIGDLCAWHFGTPLGGAAKSAGFNQLINDHRYWLQEEYSNDGSTCLQRYTPTAAPRTVAPPVVGGSPGEGQRLSTSEGAWMYAPSGYSYRWQRCAATGTGCADIPGATAATYLVTAADVGSSIRAEVTAQNAAGTSAVVVSAPTPIIVPVPTATAQPVLSGTPALGKRISTTTGAWNATVTIAYQWLRCDADGTNCVSIPGADAASHVLELDDAGHTLEARVSATNAAGTTAAISGRSGSVVNRFAATKAPQISGRTRVGRRLSASRGTWTRPPTAYRYQWLRCNERGRSCALIVRATRRAYPLTKHDAGRRLRVRVTAVDASGRAAATSRASGRVLAPRRH
ncbi:MAG: hypothetical protein ACXVRK_05815 [Gaiellaceae bacterium]